MSKNKQNLIKVELTCDDQLNTMLSCQASYIFWVDFHSVYNKDKELKRNLKKAPKLSHQALHPVKNKQNLPLAVAKFHEATIAAAESYHTHWTNISKILTIFNT